MEMDENLKNLLDIDIEKIAEDGKKRSKKRKKALIAITTVTVFAVVICTVVIPHIKMSNALEFMAEGGYEEARAIFEGNPDLLKECDYQWYKQQLEQGNFSAAVQIGFNELDGYKDSAELAKETEYQRAIQSMNEGYYRSAKKYFSRLGDYKDSAELLKKCG